MEPEEIVSLTLRGLAHDADAGLEVLLGHPDDDNAVAAAIFLQILSCRFDDALDSADALSGSGRLAVAAVGMARAVGTGLAGQLPDTAPDVGPFAGLTTMLELETAMSSGQIAAADEMATRLGADEPPTSIDQIWAGIALVRARGFQGVSPTPMSC